MELVRRDINRLGSSYAPPASSGCPVDTIPRQDKLVTINHVRQPETQPPMRRCGTLLRYGQQKGPPRNPGKGLSPAVDLPGAHYNTSVQARKLEALVKRLPTTGTQPPESPKRRKPRRARQLSNQQVDELTVAYQSGETVYDLAERFKINRKTVSGILHRAGVQIRGRLTSEQVDEAARLYAAGWSLARVAAKLDTTANTVRIRLLERGVTMRDAQGRER